MTTTRTFRQTCELDRVDDGNFKALKWSPDGSTLLASNENKWLKAYSVKDGTDLFKVTSSESIQDFCWYPWMAFDNPASNCFLSVSREVPLKILDGTTGAPRASYRPMNHLDELDGCIAGCFSPDGQQIFATAFERIYQWDVNRPGPNLRVMESSPSRKSREGQKGLLSCIQPRWDQTGVYAVGSFSGHVGIYDMRTEASESSGPIMKCISWGGVTQVAFHPSGWEVIFASRHNMDLDVWDMRNPDVTWSIGPRPAKTNQRLQFSLSSDGCLATGNSLDGTIYHYLFEESKANVNPCTTFVAHQDVVGGVAWNPVDPTMLATASGQRHFENEDNSSDSDIDDSRPPRPKDNSIKLWQYT